MKNYSLFIGIDISKKSLDICELAVESPKNYKYHKIGNDLKSIKAYLKTLKTQDVLFCMEDTGVYGMYLYRVLTENTVDFSVVPAIHIKRSKGLARGKSDKADAKDIAVFALTHKQDLQSYQMPEADLQELKMLIAEREKLVKSIKIFKATDESTCYMRQSVKKTLKKNNSETVKFLKKQLKEIESAIAELVKNNETMNTQMQLLQTIPGIGFQTALQLIIYTKCFKSFDNWRQLACYAGIAPFPYQSGTSIRGKTKVSHFAQKKLKSTLHLASLTMKRFDPEIKQYFERKVAEGKNKMSVMNAVRCKLVARAFAVINRGTPFVNTQKFIA